LEKETVAFDTTNFLRLSSILSNCVGTEAAELG
jgi:hypothetical protein